MDHVTLVTPLSRTVGCPKANNWYSHASTQNLTTLALAVPKIFHGCEILKLVTWRWSRPLRGQLVTWRLVLLVAKLWTKFEVCIALALPKILRGCNIVKLVTWPCRTTPLSGTVCRQQAGDMNCKPTHQIWSAPVLSSPVTEIWQASQNVENGVFRGHPRSLKIAPFDRVHTSSY